MTDMLDNVKSISEILLVGGIAYGIYKLGAKFGLWNEINQSNFENFKQNYNYSTQPNWSIPSGGIANPPSSNPTVNLYNVNPDPSPYQGQSIANIPTQELKKAVKNSSVQPLGGIGSLGMGVFDLGSPVQYGVVQNTNKNVLGVNLFPLYTPIIASNPTQQSKQSLNASKSATNVNTGSQAVTFSNTLKTQTITETATKSPKNTFVAPLGVVYHDPLIH